MGIAKEFGRKMAPKAAHAAPGLTSRVVLEALDRAIDGIGPLPGAAKAAKKQLDEQHGDVEKAIREVIENNVALAGAQGFATNLGGIATAAVTLPANIVGLAILQCRLIAGIAHLRGHDITDLRVRNAILATLLGEDEVKALVKAKKLDGGPYAIATAPTGDPQARIMLATEVGASLVGKVAGKRLVTFAGRRIPVVGGVVGAGSDGFSTWRAGRYAASVFKPVRPDVVKGTATEV
ncbi:EcsC family protein [Nocardioides yefusunii]|uniref:EcsC family protein n=1 Tax=Nocardioides yefusunii TaxID=2500546 RepID=A0ABW1R0W8_9ACTN|nr:EcsC family protein [Nocardioides yefusunii]